MDEIQLKYFTSVARHLSFTKAAEDCHVTQSTISKQISALEEDLKAPLFYRDKRSVVLTPAGARLANDAEDYMEHFRIINNRIKNLHLEYDCCLTIGAGPWESEMLPPLLAEFSRRYPKVKVYCTLYENELEPVRPYCIKNSMQNSGFVTSNQFCTLMAMVRAGMGITLLPEFYKPLLAADLHMADELITPLSVNYVVAANPKYHNELAENFLEVCREMNLNK